MSTEKQAKASKTPTKWIYTGAGIPTVSKYPKIYEYLKNFEDGGKFLLLVGGEKEVQFAIIKYVLEEVMERLHPDNYHLLVEKEINCLDATNGELKLGLYDDVTKSKRKIIEILNGKYHPLKRKFYDIFGKGIKKKWGDRYYRKVLKFLVKASKKEDIIFNVNYKEISTQRILVTDFLDRGEECYIEERKKSTPLTWLINLFENLTKCEILSLFDISCENNEAWLGYASEIRRRNSSFKPNYIIGTLKKGEKVENIPPAFNNLFEKVNLDDKLKAEEKLQNQVEESKNKYIFRKDGERWYIQFEDEVIKPENSDGFEYIHYLVAFH
ncbi:MAG: hypothetical protein GY941_05375, partial [Planctomycetes bacterium]|nr:hypothetical protein [Planctomycetota bacterium]